MEMNWPLEWLTYRPLKKNTLKPPATDDYRAHEPWFHEVMKRISNDTLLYEYALGLSKMKRKEKWKEFESGFFEKNLKCFQFLQSKIDTSCKYQGHDKEIAGEGGEKVSVVGQDCY